MRVQIKLINLDDAISALKKNMTDPKELDAAVKTLKELQQIILDFDALDNYILHGKE